MSDTQDITEYKILVKKTIEELEKGFERILNDYEQHYEQENKANRKKIEELTSILSCADTKIVKSVRFGRRRKY